MLPGTLSSTLSKTIVFQRPDSSLRAYQFFKVERPILAIVKSIRSREPSLAKDGYEAVNSIDKRNWTSKNTMNMIP